MNRYFGLSRLRREAERRNLIPPTNDPPSAEERARYDETRWMMAEETACRLAIALPSESEIRTPDGGWHKYTSPLGADNRRAIARGTALRRHRMALEAGGASRIDVGGIEADIMFMEALPDEGLLAEARGVFEGVDPDTEYPRPDFDAMLAFEDRFVRRRR